MGEMRLLPKQEGRGKRMSQERVFVVYDRDTGKNLVTLPLTYPIGLTVDIFRKAGYDAGWTWSTIEKDARV